MAAAEVASKRTYVYAIAPQYRKITIWIGDGDGQRISVRTVKPTPSLMRSDRYTVIIDVLNELGLPVPAYQP